MHTYVAVILSAASTCCYVIMYCTAEALFFVNYGRYCRLTDFNYTDTCACN